MLAESGLNQSLGKLREAKNLADALIKAEEHCRNCDVSSPMVCMERCDVWRVKHEIRETENIVRQTNYARRLLNALKSKRRLKLLEALCQHPSNLGELQQTLRKNGFRHSQRTIKETYVKPLLEVGLIKEQGTGFRATFYGRKARDLLTRLDSSSLSLLPLHSCCYEETVLKELIRPKTFNELAARVPRKSLSRILMRLRTKGLLVKSFASGYVHYHRVRRKTRMKLSPTERRVFEAIPQMGIPVSPLHKTVGINLRRTYKYLRRLREKKLVFAIRASRTYELTISGRETINELNEIENLAVSALNVPVPLPNVTSK